MNDVGTVGGQLEGDERPGRVTGDMGATDAQVAEQRSGVGRMLREAHRLGAMRAADLSPLVVPDQAVALDQRLLREERQEAVRDGAGADEQHRLARSL